MRKSVLAVMTPRRLQALEPTLRAYAENLIVDFGDEAVVDLVERFTFPFPGYAGFSLLGFPETDTEMLKEWSRTRVLLTYGQLPEREQVATAGDVVSMWRYVEDFVARRHAEPLDDLTSDLVHLRATSPSRSTSSTSSTSCTRWRWPGTRRRPTRSATACSGSSGTATSGNASSTIPG